MKRQTLNTEIVLTQADQTKKATVQLPKGMQLAYFKITVQTDFDNTDIGNEGGGDIILRAILLENSTPENPQALLLQGGQPHLLE